MCVWGGGGPVGDGEAACSRPETQPVHVAAPHGHSRHYTSSHASCTSHSRQPCCTLSCSAPPSPSTPPIGNSYDEEDMHTASSNGRRASSSTSSSGLGSSSFEMDASLKLTPEDFAHVRKAALQTVRVPQRVIQMIGDLRTFMQDKTEPPVYVSDRRLVKAMALMQVRVCGGCWWWCSGEKCISALWGAVGCSMVVEDSCWKQDTNIDRSKPPSCHHAPTSRCL